MVNRGWRKEEGGKSSRGRVSRGRSLDSRCRRETADREAKSMRSREASRGESDIRYDAAVTRTLDRGAICLPRKYETEIVKGIRAQRRPLAISRVLIASTGTRQTLRAVPVNVSRNGELVPALPFSRDYVSPVAPNAGLRSKGQTAKIGSDYPAQRARFILDESMDVSDVYRQSRQLLIARIFRFARSR